MAQRTAGKSRGAAEESTARGWSTYVLAFAGIYVLAQPFAASPASCVLGWTVFDPAQRLGTCLTHADFAPGFLVGTLVGLALLGVAVWELRRGR